MCVKIAVIFCIVFGGVYGMDYCKIGRERCASYRPHIGCQENEFKFLESNYRTVQLSNDDKQHILKKFNQLKNKYANGEKPYIPSATKLSVITWSDSLENLAKIGVRLKPTLNLFPCYLIDGTDRVIDFTYRNRQKSLSDLEVIDSGLEERIAYIGDLGEKSKKKADDKVWFARDFSYTVQIGCGFAKSDDWRLLKCVYNVGNELDITYDEGPPASKCKEIAQKKSKTYPALCEKR